MGFVMQTSRTSRPADPAVCPRSKLVVRDGEKINGTTVTVARGQKLVVNLPKQPANGYKWTVVAVPRELGQPTRAEGGRDRKAGGKSGTVSFTWDLISPLLQTGAKHSVTIALLRPWEEKAARTIAFHVEIA
jgi:predicted secreted protein